MILALFYELKLARDNFPMVLAGHVQEWEKSRALLIASGDKVHIHVGGELNRPNSSELEARRLTK
jgi:hypothetical protein